MASLLQIAQVANDEQFRGRVQAATAVLGYPWNDALLMHVAARTADNAADPFSTDTITDTDILDALQPDNVDPTGGE